MGFLGTIPANKLSALYDTSKRALILYAEGEVMGATYGFNFKQDTTFFGGLKFTLQAWSGPITGKKQSYTHQQSFNMILPSPVFPSGNVIIVTANHPQGIAVPIRYTGLIHAQADLEIATVDEAKLATKSKDMAELIPGHTSLNVLYKTKFNIKANSSVPEKGSVTIAYDSKYVQLVGSSIQSNDIVWTFLATEMGNTEIYVTTSGGIATFVMQETYDVKIFVL
jgi:hypothetical protein